MVAAALSRLVIGFGLLAAAIATRCLAAVDGGVVMTFGPHLPALTTIDFITAPVALLGIGIVAAGRGVGRPRRSLGLLLLVAAVAWPALKLGDMGEVLFVISARHGVHSHDLVVFPVLAAAMALLEPWHSPLLVASPTRVVTADRALLPVTQQ